MGEPETLSDVLKDSLTSIVEQLDPGDTVLVESPLTIWLEYEITVSERFQQLRVETTLDQFRKLCTEGGIITDECDSNKKIEEIHQLAVNIRLLKNELRKDRALSEIEIAEKTAELYSQELEFRYKLFVERIRDIDNKAIELNVKHCLLTGPTLYALKALTLKEKGDLPSDTDIFYDRNFILGEESTHYEWIKQRLLVREMNAFKKNRIIPELTPTFISVFTSVESTPSQGLSEFYIDPNSEGEFKGVVADIYGDATFHGKLNGVAIHFRKEYIVERSTATRVRPNYLEYRGTMGEDGNYHGFWEGFRYGEVFMSGKFILSQYTGAENVSQLLNLAVR